MPNIGLRHSVMAAAAANLVIVTVVRNVWFAAFSRKYSPTARNAGGF